MKIKNREVVMADFYQLDPDQQVERLKKLGLKALEQWSIEQPELSLMKYRENAVFAVTDATGAKRALRIHRPGYHSTVALNSELAWMEALKADGIQTPEVIHTTNGKLLVIAEVNEVPEPRQCDLLGWVDGEVLGTIEGSEEQSTQELHTNYYLAGQMAARIHCHAGQWQLPESFFRPVMDAEGLVGTKGYLGNFRLLSGLGDDQVALLDKAADAVMDTLNVFGQSSDRFGLTHADFLPENLLIDGDIIRIIDFDDCGFGWHMMDIATFLFFLLGEPGYDAAYQGLVEGYRSVRELPDSHLELLPTCLLARGLTYLAWVHSRYETETAQEIAPVLIEGVCALAGDYLTNGK
ncbi:phosphotransferase [Pseudomonas sp. MPC6]|uniref:phosphotransferase enzyme family protein n=1 Tax=unclassified Pseudomonas TaxID=196821 RepID=UPI00137594FB|nr:phosphotransferase [Pseudomonas sp. MPC6]